MSGAYCRFCGHRCFVDRRMPDDARWMPGQTVHLATCPAGRAYDLAQCGYDAGTAINPREDRRVVSITERLEYLRRQVRRECISWGEIAELQSLVEHIDPDDGELLSWATSMEEE